MFSYFYVTSSGFHGRSVILSSWNVFTPLGILKDWSISLPGTCAYNFHVFMNSWIHEIMTYQGTWKSGDQFHYQALVPTTFMFSWIHEFMNSWLIKVHENQVMLSWIHEFMTYQGKWKSGDPTDIVSHQNYDLMLMGMKACFYAFLPLC